jgi:HD-GYP domain-containing protein (c-di-GMP phosphodiesterase class II)
MTSTRPYRKALSKAEAFRELEKGAGRQFHPDLVNAFLKAIKKRDRSSPHSHLSKVI